MTHPVGSSTSTKGGGGVDDGIGSARDRSKLIKATSKVGTLGEGTAGRALNTMLKLDNLVTIGRLAMKVVPK
jgi:hypothetical protein